MSADERRPPKTPVKGIKSLTERGGGSGDHDRASRRAESPRPAPPQAFDDEVTGNFQGEALQEMRARRPTSERLARLEGKHDSLDAKVDSIQVAVADMGGQFKVIPRLVESMEKATAQLHQREHVTFTAKVDVDKAQALGDVKIKQEKWQVVTKIVAVLGTIGTAIATAIAARGC